VQTDMIENYHGAKLSSGEIKFLNDVEKIQGKPFPKISTLQSEKSFIDRDGKKVAYMQNHYGYTVKKGRINGLNLIPHDRDRETSKSIDPGVPLINLPESIGNLGNLTHIFLMNNQLSELPDSILKLKSLEYLNGCYNKLTHLPKTFGGLKNLKELILNDNQLTSLPDSFGNLENLEILNLDHNMIREIPESFGNLRNLKELILSRNRLNFLSENFGKLGSLYSLNLDTNLIKLLPKSFERLKSLQDLNLRSNKIEIFPDEISKLKRLKKLDMPDNKIKRVPKSIKNLRSIKFLNLAGNEIEEIHESFGYLKNLETLSLRSNKLSSLPHTLGKLKSLINLFLGFNQFTKFPEFVLAIPNLKHLSIWRTQIGSIPESIIKLRHLEQFNLNENKIEVLPSSIGNLITLKSLSLMSNRITNLPESFWNLKNLEELNLNENNLKSISKDITRLSNLKHLRINSNKLSKFPSDIWRMKNLEVIEIENNPWNDNWKEISGLGRKDILIFCRKREPINILLILGKNDEDQLNIEDLGSFLTSREEISQLTSFNEFYIENHSSKSLYLDNVHLVLFYASQDSLFNSMIFKDMIKLVKEHSIQVIPIKGSDVVWGDLAEVKLSRELGLEHTKEAFHQFCEELYKYIIDFKHSVDLIDREQGKFDKSLLEFRTIMKEYINKLEFKDLIIRYIDYFNIILNEYKSGDMSQLEFIQQFGITLKNFTI
jgi:Leucine-rich repeat (LRR) protein